MSIVFKDTSGQLSFVVNSPRVNERSSLKTVVGTVEAKDPDPGTLTLSLDDSAGGRFSIAAPSSCARSVRTRVKTFART